MVTIKNTELLDEKGLEAIIDENGEVNIQRKKEELVNGGKWMPKEDEPYFAVLDFGINATVYDFSKFYPYNDFEKRHLRNGNIFPTKEMAERVASGIRKVINDAWEEYEKKINALNRENDERKD